MSARHAAPHGAPSTQQIARQTGQAARAAEAVVADIAAGRHRRPPVRRSALYLAAAAGGAVLVNVLVGAGPSAQAEPATADAQAVSVAQQLGITTDTGSGTDTGSTDAAAELSSHLGDLAASRAQRETDEATAATAQAQADQAAAEVAAAAQAQAQADAEAAAQAAAAAAAEAAAENATAADFKTYALAQLAGDEDEFSCLESLWGRESQWNPDAQNPSSTAYGIPQFLDSTWAGTGIAKTSNGFRQIDAGLIYLDERYGSPCGGWAHSQSTGWY